MQWSAQGGMKLEEHHEQIVVYKGWKRQGTCVRYPFTHGSPAPNSSSTTEVAVSLLPAPSSDAQGESME